MNHRCRAQACQWMPQTFGTKFSAILFRNTNRRWYRLLVWNLKFHFSMRINASFPAIHGNVRPFWSWQTDVKMLLTDKLGYTGCARAVETTQRAKGKGVAQCSNYTPLRHPWLSSLWNSLSCWSQLPVKKLARKRAFVELFPAPSTKIYSQLFFYFPKVGEIKTNCIVIIIAHIVMQESRKEKQTNEEIETKKQRQRKWKEHDIRKAVGKSKGENTGLCEVSES